MDSNLHLSEILHVSRKTPKVGEHVSWRVNANNFASNSPTRKHVAGAETFSAGWYAQAHNVGPSSPHPNCILNTMRQKLNDRLAPSCSLRDEQNRTATTSWLTGISESENYLNMILLLIHPDLHRIGSTILERLKVLEDTREFAQLWRSYFTGIAVINN